MSPALVALLKKLEAADIAILQSDLLPALMSEVEALSPSGAQAVEAMVFAALKPAAQQAIAALIAKLPA